MASSSRTEALDFGKTYVVNPTGKHVATIVWLHDIGRTGLDSLQTVESLLTPNIKWICPTAPVRPITSLGGKKTTAWFDVYSPICEGMREDLDSLNFINLHVSWFLVEEPSDVIKGIGGYGMGAAQSLFYASSYTIVRVPIDPKIVIGVNGWLPDLENLKANMRQHPRSAICAASLQILITYGVSNDINSATYAKYKFVDKCCESLRSSGFNLSFKPYGGDVAMHEIRTWLLAHVKEPCKTKKLGDKTKMYKF